MRSWFLKKKYPKKQIDSEMKKVIFFSANLQTKKRENGVPLLVTYHPILNNCNWTRTHNHLVHKRTLNHLAKLAK